MTARPYAFHDLPAAAFPIVMEFFKATDRAGRNPVHRIDVTAPWPQVIDIPALGAVWVRVTLGDGSVAEHRRPGGADGQEATA